MMDRKIRAVVVGSILVLLQFTLLILYVYDVIRLDRAQFFLISSNLFWLFYFIATYQPKVKTPVKTLDPITLTALSRSLELRDGVRHKLVEAANAEAGEGNLDITLIDPGPRKIKAIGRLRQLYDIELTTAAALVDAAPVIIRAGASRAEADYVADCLAQSGAKVDVTEAER